MPLLNNRSKRIITGSVSVLLAVLIMPMLTVAGIVLDGSRISAARTAASGACELALNSALADYDRLFYGLFGLFAVSSDDDELTENVSRYFRESIEADGYLDLCDSYSRSFLNALTGFFGVKDSWGGLVDMTAVDFSIESAGSSAIANPAVMEKQIVEYMKYRGPLLLADGLLTKLDSFRGISGQTAAAEKKIEYDTEYSGVQPLAKAAWDALNSYLSAQSSAKLPADRERTEEILDAAGDIFRLFILSVLAEKFFSDAFTLPFGGDSADLAKTDELSLSDLYRLLNDRDCLETAEFVARKIGSGGHDLNADASDPEGCEAGLAEAVGFLFEVYDRSDSISRLCAAGDLFLTASKKQTGDDLPGEQGISSSDLEKTGKRAVVCIQQISLLSERADAVLENLREYQQVLLYAGTELLYSGLYLPLKNQRDLLSAAEDSLEALRDKLSTVEKARDNWKNTVERLDEGSFKSGMESDLFSSDDIDTEALDKLAAALKKDRSILDRLISRVSGITLCGAELKADKGPGEAVRKKLGEIQKKLIPSAYTAADSIFSDAEKRSSNGYSGWAERLLRPSDRMSFTAALSKDYSFYSDLKRAFGEKSSSAHSQKETAEAAELKQLLQTAGSADMSAGGPDLKLPDGIRSMLGEEIAAGIGALCSAAEITASFDSISLSGENDEELAGSAADSLGKATSLLTGLKNIASASLDTLYVEEYISGMFSCLTDACDDKTKESPVSISGHPLNSNPCFGAEMEYILCGIDSPKSNVTSVKAMIFTVRFALNLLFVMTDSESRAETLAVAEAVAGWTGFGAPIVQNVLLAAWALAESGVDLSLLSSGKSVPVYKSRSTWNLGFSGLKNAIISGAAEAAGKAVNDIFEDVSVYASNLTAENIDRLAAELEDYSDGMLGELYGEIQTMLEVPIADFARMICTASERIGVDRIKTELDELLNDFQDKAGGLYGICLKAAAKAVGEDSAKIAKEIWSAAGALSGTDGTESLIREKLYGKDGNGGIIGSVKKKIEGTVKKEIDGYRDSFKEDIDRLIREKSDSLAAEVTKRIEKFASGLTSSEGEKSSVSTVRTGSGFAMSYKDYLRMFILISYQAKKNTMLKRVAEMMQLDVRVENKTFDISKCRTLLTCSAVVSVRTSFGEVPLFMGEKENKRVFWLEISKIGKGSRTFSCRGAASY